MSNALPAPTATTQAIVPGTIVRLVRGGYAGSRGTVVEIIDQTTFGFLFLDGMGEVEYASFNQVEIECPIVTPAAAPMDAIKTAVQDRCDLIGLVFKPEVLAAVLDMIEDEIADGHFDQGLRGE